MWLAVNIQEDGQMCSFGRKNCAERGKSHGTDGSNGRMAYPFLMFLASYFI